MSLREPVNPYAPTVEVGGDEQPVGLRLTRASRFARMIAIVILIGVLLGAAIAAYDVGTIIISGPSLFVLGLLLWIFDRHSPRSNLWIIGAVSMLFCVGCVVAINLKGWGPPQAQWPIGSACVVFAMVIQFGWVWIRKPNSVTESEELEQLI